MRKLYLVFSAAFLLLVYKIVFAFFVASLDQYKYEACLALQIVLVLPAIYCMSLFLASCISEEIHTKISSWLSRWRGIVFLMTVSIIAIVLTSSIYHVLFHRSSAAFDLDEIGYIFQAKNFALGRLYSPAPPENIQKFFDTYHVVIHNGKTFGRYPFGHSVILMPGFLIGAVELIFPLIAALNIMLIYYIARELYDRHSAVWSSLLCLFCPYFLAYSSTLLSEGTSLLFFALFLFFFIKFVRNPAGMVYPLLCGLFLGLKFNTRPVSALSICIPCIFFALYLLYREGWRYVKGYVLIVCSFGLMLGLFFLYNYALTGDPLLMPYNIYAPHDRLGFGPEFGGALKEWGAPEGHTLMKGLRAVPGNILSVNRWLGGGFPIPLVLLLLLIIRIDKDKWDWLLLGSMLSMIAFIIPYWCSSYLLAPLDNTTYYFDAILPLSLLSGRGLWIAAGETSTYKKRVLVMFFMLSLCACLYSLTGPLGRIFSLTKNYAKLDEQIKAQGIHNSLIFVQTEPNKPQGIPLLPYHNNPTFRGDIVYALNLGSEENKQLLSFYSDRTVYLWHKNSSSLKRCPAGEF